MLIDGLLTNDKFCVVRSSRLTLSWSRAPVHQQRVSLRLHAPHRILRNRALPAEDQMYHQWRVRRQTTSSPDGQQRWDRAYQLLLRWTECPALPPAGEALLPATGPTGKPMQAEVPHAHRRVRARFNAQPDAKADH